MIALPRPLALVVTSFVLLAPADAQTDWQQVATAVGPAARTVPAIAYDSARGRAVMFGGYFGSGIPRPNDTWEWDGTQWQQRFPEPAPPGRESHGMAYDPLRGRTVLFGGSPGNGLFGDTWEYDGNQWTEVAGQSPIGDRLLPAMTFDPATGRVLLFGGSDGSPQGGTWTWDGASWQQLATVNAPSARDAAAMAHDPRRGRVVLFGGRTVNTMHGDTWLWDGSNWAQLLTGTAPSPRWGHSLVFDAARGVLVLFGGSNNLGVFDDTWELGPNGWTERFPTNAPSRRRGHVTAYHPASRSVMLFGGINGASLLADTWDYRPLNPATYTAFGTGCPGAAGTPAFATATWQAPWIGETFDVTIENLTPGSATSILFGASISLWGALPLPASLAPFMPGCSLLVSADIVLPVANPTGTATVSVPIPDVLALIGATYHNQVFTADPTVTGIGLIVSHAATAVVGAK